MLDFNLNGPAIVVIIFEERALAARDVTGLCEHYRAVRRMLYD